MKDNQLLLQKDIAIGFSLWSLVREYLEAEGVRFDKIDNDDISWSPKELEEIINKRLMYFTDNDINNVIDFCTLVPSKNDRNLIIQIANCSPRDLIQILKEIYTEQNSTSEDVTSFDSSIVHKGILKFIRNYNYSAHDNSKNKEESRQIKSTINRVLATRVLTFDLQTIATHHNLKAKEVQKICDRLVDLEVLEKTEIYLEDEPIRYKVIDPKIEFLIKKSEVSLN